MLFLLNFTLSINYIGNTISIGGSLLTSMVGNATEFAENEEQEKEMINEIDNPECISFAIESFSKFLSSIASGNLKTRIRRNVKVRCGLK